jgi:hypothetical protein
MTPKFLREQATHFRGMADMTDLTTSNPKLLTLAEDYEALAKAAENSTASEIMVRAGEKIAKELKEAA